MHLACIRLTTCCKECGEPLTAYAVKVGACPICGESTKTACEVREMVTPHEALAMIQPANRAVV